MPEVDVTVGGRTYAVACQDGEEHFLRAAAAMLDAEASVLLNQIGRLPEARLMLMAGLMLADKTAGIEDQLREMREELKARNAELAELGSEPRTEPAQVEVPVIPEGVTESLATLAARAEALADRVAERAWHG